MDKQTEIYRKEGCTIEPNCFSLQLNDSNNAFIFSFAQMDKEKTRIDVLSEMSLPENGFMTIFKSMFEVAFEYEKETGKDLIEQILNDMEEVHENED